MNLQILRECNYDYDTEQNDQQIKAENVVLKQAAMFEAAAELAAEVQSCGQLYVSMNTLFFFHYNPVLQLIIFI